jgi:hypothetical protein
LMGEDGRQMLILQHICAPIRSYATSRPIQSD